MKYLTVIRHAKSLGAESAREDRGRELNERGKSDAPVMARVLIERGALPDLLAASPVIRARQTVDLLNSVLQLNSDRITFDETLYMALPEEMANVVKKTGEVLDHLAIVGHNPCVTDYVNELCGTDIENIPTCGIAHIKLAVETWKAVSAGSGTLVWLVSPEK